MGGGASTAATTQSIEEQAEALFPAYFIRDAVISPEDIEHAKRAWNSIVDDEVIKYTELRDSNQLSDTTSCLAWFYDVFYIISEERDHNSMAMYGNGMKAQVKALVGMISMTLNLFKTNDMPKIITSLEKVAKGHVGHIGVRAYQFPIVGQVLLQTFERVLGPQFDEPTRLAWTKLISAVMAIMIPAVLREEALLTPEQRQEHCDKIKSYQDEQSSKENHTLRKLAQENESSSVHMGGYAQSNANGAGVAETANVSEATTASEEPKLETICEGDGPPPATAAAVSAKVSKLMKEESMKAAAMETEGAATVENSTAEI
jgi:hemoglobin-like flavoprotein